MVSSRSVTSRSKPCSDGPVVGQRGQALHAQSGGEEPLNDVIMKVPSNPVPILEHGQPLLIRAGLDQLAGQGGMVGERLGHVPVGGGEVASS